VKRSLLVEAAGGPLAPDAPRPPTADRLRRGRGASLRAACPGLAVVVAPANVHDSKLLKRTLEAVIVKRPRPTRDRPQHLCLDKGYDNPSGREAARAQRYTPHIRRIGQEKLDGAKRKRPAARRWVVERTLAWLSKCRAVLVRYDKKSCNYLGLLKLACALLWFRRLRRLAA
jgi:putative transposase